MISPSDYMKHDATGLASLVESGEVTASELLEAAINRAEEVNPRLNAIVATHYDLARKRAGGEIGPGPFRGVPFLVKDLGIGLAGTATTGGSRFLLDAVADRNTTLADRYLAAGLVIFGKTATPEFGAVPTTESLLWGATRNPWSLEHSTGGSSGGAGAAVAAGVVPAAHGNDGGGSIRFPAANCAVFGLKPSRGRVPLASGFDSGGGLAVDHVLSRSVRDSAALLDATHGPEPGDPYIARPPGRRYVEDVGDRPKGLRVAVQRKPFVEIDVHADCLEGLDRAAALCASLGHDVEELSPPPITAADVYGVMPLLMGIEMTLAISEHEARTGRAATEAEIEPRNWTTAQFGKTIGAPQYEKVRMAVRAVGRSVIEHQRDYDVVLSPTLGMPPPPLGLLGPAASYEVYAQASIQASAFTIVYNFSGQPAMSVPLHWNDQGLPVGMMFAARPGDEGTLYQLAGQLEEAQPWRDRRPPI